MNPSRPPFPTIAWVATRSPVPPALLQGSNHPSLRNGRYHPSLRNVKRTPNSNSHPSPAVQPDHVNGSFPSPHESGGSLTTSNSTDPSMHPIVEDGIAVVNLEEAARRPVVPQNEAVDEQAQFQTKSAMVPVLGDDLDAALPRGEKRPHASDDLMVNDSNASTHIAKRKRVE